MLLRNYLFHRVSDETDPHWPPMRPQMFDRIIESLVRKERVVLLEDFLQDQLAFKNYSGNLITISFDDGYKDNIEYAAPILKKYNCPASFYIVTGCIDTNTPTWTYLIDYILGKTSIGRIEFIYDFVPDDLKLIQLNGKSSRHVVTKVKPWLKTLPNHQRTMVIQTLLEQCNDINLPSGQMMSWDDIRQLKSSGFHVGSHSHSHPMLASLDSNEEIRNELMLSYSRINNELSAPPVTISYPIGSYDKRVIEIAKEVGYKYGLAVEQKFFRFDPVNLFSISRVELYQEPWWKSQLRISGIISSVKSIWQ